MESKNVIAAIALSSAVIVLYSLFFIPEQSTTKQNLIENHHRYTNSPKAKRILDNFENYLPKFIKVMPTEYKRVLMDMYSNKETSKDSVKG